MNQRVTYPFLILMFSHLCAMDQGNFSSPTSSINDQDFARLVANATVFFKINREQQNEQESADDRANTAPSSNTQSLTAASNQVQNHMLCRFGCNIQLSNNSSLNRHERTFHSEYARYKCVTCNNVFFSERGLKQHCSIQGHAIIYRIQNTAQ